MSTPPKDIKPEAQEEDPTKNLAIKIPTTTPEAVPDPTAGPLKTALTKEGEEPTNEELNNKTDNTPAKKEKPKQEGPHSSADTALGKALEVSIGSDNNPLVHMAMTGVALASHGVKSGLSAAAGMVHAAAGGIAHGIGAACKAMGAEDLGKNFHDAGNKQLEAAKENFKEVANLDDVLAPMKHFVENSPTAQRIIDMQDAKHADKDKNTGVKSDDQPAEVTADKAQEKSTAPKPKPEPTPTAASTATEKKAEQEPINSIKNVGEELGCNAANGQDIPQSQQQSPENLSVGPSSTPAFDESIKDAQPLGGSSPTAQESSVISPSSPTPEQNLDQAQTSVKQSGPKSFG